MCRGGRTWSGDDTSWPSAVAELAPGSELRGPGRGGAGLCHLAGPDRPGEGRGPARGEAHRPHRRHSRAGAGRGRGHRGRDARHGVLSGGASCRPGPAQRCPAAGAEHAAGRCRGPDGSGGDLGHRPGRRPRRLFPRRGRCDHCGGRSHAGRAGAQGPGQRALRDHDGADTARARQGRDEVCGRASAGRSRDRARQPQLRADR